MENKSTFKRQRTTTAATLLEEHLHLDPSFSLGNDDGRSSSLQQSLGPPCHTIRHQTLSITAVTVSLKQAFTTEQRLCTLQNLLQQQLQYDFTTRECSCPPTVLRHLCNHEVLSILTCQLASCFRNAHWNESNALSLIEMLLRTLDLIYRSAPDLVHDEVTIQRQGTETAQLLSLVYQQVDLHRSRFRGSDAMHVHSAVGTTIMLLLSIWHSFSSSSSGSSILLQRPEILPTINRMFSYRQDVTAGMAISLEGTGLLKNLSYFGEEHRNRIVACSDLIATLCSLSTSANDKVVERLSAVFRNFALSSDVRLQLAQRSDVLAAMVCMLSKRNFQSDHVAGESTYKHILRNTLSTISNLAMDTSSVNLLLFHGDGVLINHVVTVLTQSNDAVVRKRAAKSLRLLARDTASISPMTVVVQRDQLLNILSNLAMCDPNEGVRTESQEAFAKCANLIRSPMEQYQAVLDTLTRMAINTINGVIPSAEIVTKALQEQASHIENRNSMGRRKELLEGLARILRSESTSQVARDNVCRTFLDLSKESTIHPALASPIILQALVETMMDKRVAPNEIASTSERMREAVAHTVLNLSHSRSTWKTMASQTSLLRSLLQFASSRSTDPDLKKDIKDAILRLASEL